MNYVIVTIGWCLAKGIIVPEHARKSIDGKKVILHYDFITPVIGSTETIEVYNHSSKELDDMLNSSEWTIEEQTNEEINEQ